MIVKLVKVKLDVRDATGLDNPVKQRTNVDVSILLLKELLDMKQQLILLEVKYMYQN